MRLRLSSTGDGSPVQEEGLQLRGCERGVWTEGSYYLGFLVTI
jgi:hypothetical protein